MVKELIILKNKFWSGQVRDDKATIAAAWGNIEELDIFSNADYIQPEQIFSADALPAGTEVFAYDAGDDDTVYTFGRETSGSKVWIGSVSGGGAVNPGSISTLFTSADATNLATRIGDVKFFRTTESPATYLYYIAGTGSTWLLKRYSITGAAESTVGTLTGLDGSFDRPTFKVLNGELLICNGNFIAKVDKDGTFTNAAFTLPKEWEAVDVIGVSDVAIILSRNKNRLVNYCRGFWWDLTSATGFDDKFDLPIGGPQWIFNHKETIKIFCALNGVGRFFQLSGAFPGAIPLELPNIGLTNMGTELTLRPISQPKMVGTKDRILYFGLLKTDKSGVYALGQLDSDKPNALLLSKRFNTTDYSLHRPTALLIHGSNFYGAYDDNGTETTMRCETLNSPTRSSNATCDTIWLDNGQPMVDKKLENVILLTKKIPTGTSVSASIATDYDDDTSGDFTAVTRRDGSVFNTVGGVLGKMPATSFVKKKAFKSRVSFISSGTSAVQFQGVGLHMILQDVAANA